jgi:hypothetical protein
MPQLQKGKLFAGGNRMAISNLGFKEATTNHFPYICRL